MIQKLIEFSIRKRILVTIIFGLLSVLSIYSIFTARIDAIPDVGENQQIVFSEWPGRSPKDIEEQVTYPLSIHLQGLPGVKNIRAMSAFGFSMVYVVFKEDIDFYWSRSRVLEKLSTASDLLPSGVVPKMGPDATGLGQVFWYTLENSPDNPNPLSLGELRTLQDFYVKYLLQGVEGVSEVSSVGGFVKEYQIDVDPKKIFAYGIPFTDVVKAIENSNLDVGAEVIEEGGREFIVRGKGFFDSLEDIENVVLTVKDRTPIRVKDVAHVGRGPAFRRGALDKNGIASVGGVVAMRFGLNPKEVIDKLKEKIIEIEKGLPKGVKLVPFYDRTELVEDTIETVYSALTEEMIITVVVILIFLLHIQSSILVSLTLPLGIGISFILMKLLDIDSNIMSLSGLVIAIGTMIDMGIIVIENIYTQLSENPNVDKKEKVEIITKASKEVGPPIVTAVLTTIISFLPVFGLTGSEGKLFGPLAWAKTLAMFGAVIVSVILIPCLSVFLLRGKLRPLEKNKVSLFIQKHYKPIITWVLEHRKTFMIAPILLIIAGAFAFTRLGKEFMPSLNEGQIIYMPTTTPDISLTKARELLAYTDKVLFEHPLVESAVGKLGRAESPLDPAPVAMFETVVSLVPEEKWPEGMDIYGVMDELDKKLQVPGLVNTWDFPIQVRVGMISSGIKTQVGVKVFGPDLEKLEEIAAKIGKTVQEVQGATGVYAEQIMAKPYVEFEVNRIAASRYGINAGVINKIIQTAVGGMQIGQFYDGRNRFPIRVRYKAEFRNQLEELKRVLVPSPLGLQIPLEQLTSMEIVTGPATIQSENGQLRSLVMFNVKGRDVIGFVEEAKEAVERNLQLPAGYTLSWEGNFANQKRANDRLMILVPISLLISFVVVYFGLGSFRNAAILFMAIPISLAGGLIFLWIGDFNTSVAVWVGFIAVFGMAVDDGVVKMTYIQESIKEKKPQNFDELKDAIIDADMRRIRPLLMTLVTTIVALLPVLWATSKGSEIMKPMALPIMGGLVFGAITIFVMPVLFSFFEERRILKRE